MQQSPPPSFPLLKRHFPLSVYSQVSPFPISPNKTHIPPQRPPLSLSQSLSRTNTYTHSLSLLRAFPLPFCLLPPSSALFFEIFPYYLILRALSCVDVASSSSHSPSSTLSTSKSERDRPKISFPDDVYFCLTVCSFFPNGIFYASFDPPYTLSRQGSDESCI